MPEFRRFDYFILAKKDSVGEISNDSDSDNEFENANEKKDSVEEVEDDNQSPDQEEAKEEGTASEVDEEDTSSPEEDGDKKDKVPVEVLWFSYWYGNLFL